MSFALWVPRRSCCCSHIRLNSRGVMQDCPCALECVGVTNSQWTMKGTGLHQDAAWFRDCVATVVVISVVNKIFCVEAKPEWKILRLARIAAARVQPAWYAPFVRKNSTTAAYAAASAQFPPLCCFVFHCERVLPGELLRSGSEAGYVMSGRPRMRSRMSSDQASDL